MNSVIKDLQKRLAEEVAKETDEEEFTARCAEQKKKDIKALHQSLIKFAEERYAREIEQLNEAFNLTEADKKIPESFR